MEWSIFKEPVVWVASGVMAIIWSVLANIVTPKIISLFVWLRKPKKVKNYEKNSKKLAECIELQEDKVQRYELKLEAIHRELIGIAFYLISFATLSAALLFEPKLFIIFVSVVVFFVGTRFIDTGINMMNTAKLAAQRSRELTIEKKKDEESDLSNFQEELNVRDFGIKS